MGGVMISNFYSVALLCRWDWAMVRLKHSLLYLCPDYFWLYILVWRFPFAALENGGGAFLIPYFIVLFVVGRPIYYLEMIVGQFSSRGSAKVYDMVPAMRGSYYHIHSTTQLQSLNSLTTHLFIYFLTVSFNKISWKLDMPWNRRQQYSCICYNSHVEP